MTAETDGGHSPKSGGPGRWAFVYAAAGLVAALALLFPIAYGANDDSGVLLSLAVTPDEAKHPLLTPLAPSFAVLLGWAYQKAPFIPWYGLALMIGNSIGVGLMLHAFWHAPLARQWKILAAPALAVLILECVFWWTFTKVMLLLQLAGFLQFVHWQVNEPEKRFPWFWVLVPLLLGYQFRAVFYKLTMSCGFPIALYFHRRSVLPAVVVAVAVNALIFADDYSFRNHLKQIDEGYQAYETFHYARYPVHDLPEGYPNPKTPEALKSVGWTDEDYKFFRTLWGIYDDAEFEPEKIHAFLDANKKGLKLAATLSDVKASGWFQVMAKSAGDNGPFLAALAIPALALIVLFAGSLARREGAPFDDARRVVVVLGLVVLLVYLFFNRFPIRVSVPLFMYSLCLSAVIAPRGGPTFSRNTGKLAFLLAVAGCSYFVYSFVDTLRTNAEINRSIGEFLAGMDADSRGRVLLVTEPTKGFCPEMLHPLFQERDFDRGLIVVPCGTKVNSPLYKRFLQLHHLKDGRAMLAAAMRGEVLFFSNDDSPDALPLWESYLNRHLARDAGFKVKFETIRAVKNNFGTEVALRRLVRADG